MPGLQALVTSSSAHTALSARGLTSALGPWQKLHGASGEGRRGPWAVRRDTPLPVSAPAWGWEGPCLKGHFL